MKTLSFAIIIAVLMTFTGCGMSISPFSPRMDQKLKNQGKIDDIKNNQNGMMLELGKIRQQQEISARDAENLQQGMLNMRGNDNSGVQILSGDGGLLIVFAIATMSIVLIYHYRTRAMKSEKTASIFAQQIALHNDTTLDDRVFMSALNTDVEDDVYHLMVKSQAITGKTKV